MVLTLAVCILYHAIADGSPAAEERMLQKHASQRGAKYVYDLPSEVLMIQQNSLKTRSSFSNKKAELGGGQMQDQASLGPETSETLLRTGHYELGDRSFEVTVPAGDGPFEVLLLFHFRGSTGSTMVGYMNQLMDKYILVAPNGEQESWNVLMEPSSKDDIGFIGNLVNYTASFSNVHPTFTLLGYSNGAALTNRILIENDDPRIVAAITSNTQLSEFMHHDDNLYIGGLNNSYSVPKPSLVPRRLLQITTATDPVVPCCGDGLGPGGMKFLSWEESAYRYALSFGYRGKHHQVEETDSFFSVIYLDGLVKAYNMKAGFHIFQGNKLQAVQFLNERLGML